MVQIPIAGLRIESIVSFPHNHIIHSKPGRGW